MVDTVAQRISRIVLLALLAAWPVVARAQLPRDPGDLLIIGDSITAGVYFLGLDQESIRQSWSGQLVRRLGLDVPRSPFDYAYPIDHLKLTKDGFGPLGFGYAWAARRAVLHTGSRYRADEERIVLAVPAQTVRDVLEQSSLTKELNKRSTGWAFASVMLPESLSVIQTVEQWKKRPRWVVVFIGGNDLLASFGIVGAAQSTDVATFRDQYAELVARLRKTMAPDAPPAQLILLTLPDVTTLPFIQDLPAAADDGSGARYPQGTKASAFVIPYRSHFGRGEVWTPDDLDVVRRRLADYNAAIEAIAGAGGFRVVDMNALLHDLAADSSFSQPKSPYFSPDLVHPSYRTHEAIANAVLDTMASIAGEPVPPLLPADAGPLPDAAHFTGRPHARVNAMMHLAEQDLQSGSLPPSLTSRFSFEAGAQGGDERVGDAVLVGMAGLEIWPAPASTRYVIRTCMNARVAVAAFHTSNDDADFFPKESVEARLGLAFEPIGNWNWNRFEFGGLITPGDPVAGGYYLRQEWHMLYLEVSSRGWEPDRFEAGLRIGRQPGRSGRNGN